MPRIPIAASCRSTGRLTTYRPPAEHRDEDSVIRVDDGVTDGGEVSMFYDPMIAKLISWAPTREEAIDERRSRRSTRSRSTAYRTISISSRHCSSTRGSAPASSPPASSPRNIPKGFARRAGRRDSCSTDLAALGAIVELTCETRAALIDGQLGEPHIPGRDADRSPRQARIHGDHRAL